MNERAIGLLREIEKNCLIILESWRLKDNQHIATRLGLENILILCKLLVEEIEKGSFGKTGKGSTGSKGGSMG